MKIIFLILIFQQPEWIYQYVHPDIGDEWPSKIVVDSFGNSYTTGVIGPVDTLDRCGLGVIWLNMNGNEKGVYKLFPRSYGHGIAINHGYMYIAGDASTPVGYPTFLILCADTTGDIKWVYRDTLHQGAGTAIKIGYSGDIYATGYKILFNQTDIVLLKFDSLGNLKWQYIYDGGSYDEANNLEIDSNENIYIAGNTTQPGTMDDFCVLKIDSSGNLKWIYTYNGPANYIDNLYAMAMDKNSNIYVTGRSWGIHADICAIKIDPSGNEKWVYRYNGGGNYYDEGRDIVVDDSGNVYVCGISLDYDSTTLFTVIKIDSLGNERWVYLDKGIYNNTAQAQSICLDNSGNLYVGGFCKNSLYNPKLYLIKMNSMGNVIWRYVYENSPQQGWTRHITSDIHGNIYLTGKVSDNGGDIIVMKFKNETNVNERDLGLEVRDSGFKRDKIFDITGREVERIDKKGVYFLKEKDRIKKILLFRRR